MKKNWFAILFFVFLNIVFLQNQSFSSDQPENKNIGGIIVRQVGNKLEVVAAAFLCPGEELEKVEWRITTCQRTTDLADIFSKPETRIFKSETVITNLQQLKKITQEYEYIDFEFIYSIKSNGKIRRDYFCKRHYLVPLLS